MNSRSDRERSALLATAVPTPRRGEAPSPCPLPSPPMTVEIERLADGTFVVAVVGDVDMLTAPQLRTALTTCLEQGCSALVVDLREIAFLASSGLAVLVDAKRAAERLTTPLRLIATTRVVTRPLAATGLIDVFDVCGTLQEASKIA